MNKLDLSTYLVNLHTLMQAQTAGSASVASQTLAAEYEKSWGLLKEAISKENEDETGKRE